MTRRDLPDWRDLTNRRAMLFCRVSDAEQVKGQSLDAQQHLQLAYAKEHGLDVVTIHSFQETARLSKLRKTFHAAIKEASRKDIPHLVFYMWDRIARNSTDAEMLEEMIRAGDVVLHIANERRALDANSDDSDFFL